MKRCHGILLALWFALMSFPLAAQSGQPSLTLVKRIPLNDVINNQGQALKASAIADRLPISLSYNPATAEYGFIKGGKAFTPGWGGWVFDIEAGTWKQELPAGLSEMMISRDGTKISGMLLPEPGSTTTTGDRFGLDTLTGEPWNLEYGLLHPDNQTTVDGESVASLHPDEVGHAHAFGRLTIISSTKGLLFVNLAESEQINKIRGFTDDGRYLVLNLCTLLDVKTGKILPEPAGAASSKASSDDYIGDSDVFVFNRDASWIAGGYNGGFSFIWDRIQKTYVWRGKPYSLPSAFSPNDKYLLCEGVIASAATGEAVFKDLKGIRGKFSPDGRSLVTVDKEAFYIYTLSKDSEPIFGVFQKPAPWSPPVSKKPAKAPTKKPVKKP